MIAGKGGGVEGLEGRTRTCFLASAPNRLIIVIQDDADLIHKTDLLLIVSSKIVAVRDGGSRRLGKNFPG